MYQPVNGSREAVCSGGHIGPPLREAGRCSGANGNWCKTGALRGGTEPAPYRGTGAGRRWKHHRECAKRAIRGIGSRGCCGEGHLRRK